MQGKKEGGRRFSGYGLNKWDPKPGSVAFYKANLPDKLRTVAINLRNGLGCSLEEAEQKAALVLSWSEKPLANLVGSGALDLPDKCPSCGTYTNHEAAERRAKTARS